MNLPIGNYISLTIFWWMYIKGNNSFHQRSVLQHVTAPDSDSVWHLLVKSYISKSRGLCKVFSQMILSQGTRSQKSDYVCNFPWMSYTFMGKPKSSDSGICKWKVWNRVSRRNFPPSSSSPDTATPPERWSWLPLWTKNSCSPSYLLSSMGIYLFIYFPYTAPAA